MVGEVQENKRAHNFKDLTGKVFGKLTVIGFSHIVLAGTIKNKVSYWKVKCSCGIEKNISGNSLIMNNAKSCGCSKKQSSPKNTKIKEKGEVSWNTMYSIYKWRANKKHIIFELTKEQFKEICSNNCYYSNHPPRKINKAKWSKSSNEAKERQWIYANGIDRVDNTKGYTLDNCVACCEMCNIMKMDNSAEEFYKHIIEIYKNLITKNIINKIL